MSIPFTLTRNIAPPDVVNPDILRLFALWQDNSVREEGWSLDDLMSGETLAWCWPNLMILQIKNGDYEYRHYGSDIAEISGFDMTGRRVSEFESEISKFFKSKYDLCLRERGPIFTVHRARHVNQVHTWERLLLPLLGADGRVEAILAYNKPRILKHELLNAILESAHSGILALEPARDSNDLVTGFIVSACNGLAAEVFEKSTSDLLDQLLPLDEQLSRLGHLGSMLVDVTENGRPKDTQIRIAGKNGDNYYRISVRQMGTGVTVTFTDVTEIASTNLALTREVERRRILESQLTKLATTDELTGLWNRRRFMEAFDYEFEQHAKKGKDLSLLTLDIDHFKKVNDRFGHPAGDHVLTTIARTILDHCRAVDVAARLGGEEFNLLLPGVDSPTAKKIAERLRQAIAETCCDYDGRAIRVTTSIGICTATPAESSAADCLRRADAALYAAKDAGRNRVHACRELVA